MRYIYGYDLARMKDFFAVHVHSLEGNRIPKLVTLRKMQAPYPEVLRALKNDLWVRYPPYLHVTDYTNEKTFTDLLIERYGKERVEPINFTPANKLMLKQGGRKIQQMGYVWPKSSEPKVQAWIDETQSQLKREQMFTTSSGIPTFDHPSGEHNDLAISWELSIHGCLMLMQLPSSTPIAVSANSDDDYWKQAKSRSQLAGENALKRLKGIEGLNITDVKID